MEIKDAPLVGPVIQKERKARHLTLERLSALSGVSKSMLSQIERGEANPTFAVLWSLTQALKIDFTDLIGGGLAYRRSNTIEHVTLHLTPEIKSPDNLWRLRILSPPNMAGRVEWYELELDPGASLKSSPHSQGTIEHLTAHSDGVQVETQYGITRLNTGETARYNADVPHQITNTSTLTTRALMVVIYEI